jgi:hypothetical protein
MTNLLQPVSAVALAATIAAAITILPTLSDPVDASTQIKVAIAAAPVPVSSKCAEQAWPNIDADCVRDSRRSEGVAKPVSRTVSIDRKAGRKTERKTAEAVAPIHAPVFAALTKTASPPARR